MNRVVVLGSPGSGKSTFAIRLAQRTALPLYHLDQLYWCPDVAAERWIIDGNYTSTIDVRVTAAATVLYLDRSRLLCLWRILNRRWKYRRQPRPDITAGCPENLNWEFIHWTLNYPSHQAPIIQHRLAALRADQRLVRLRSDAAAEQFLNSVTVAAPV